MKLIYCLMILLCPYITKAQVAAIGTALIVGDTVPDIYFKNVLNYKRNTASLYEFKKKLVILDFWAGYCSGCLHKFPLLDSLQKALKPYLNVLLISSSPADKTDNTNRLIKHFAAGKDQDFAMPVFLGDTLANDLLPHLTIPHYVWLNEDFKIIAITGADDITAEKISNYISGNKVSFGQKDIMEKFDPDQPLFFQNNAGNGEGLLFRSSISKFIPGLGVSARRTNEGNEFIKLTYINHPVVYLLTKAYKFFDRVEWFHYPPNDTTLNLAGKDDGWIINHSYTYELITPPVSKTLAMQYMQEDLRRYFGVTAKIDTVPTQCFLLEADTAVLNSIDSRKIVNTLKNSDGLFLQNISISTLAETLDLRLELHVINNVISRKIIDIPLPASKLSKDYQAILSHYGLRLIPAVRMLPNLFIYQTSNKSL